LYLQNHSAVYKTYWKISGSIIFRNFSPHPPALLGLIDVGYEDERVEIQVERLQDVKDECVDLQVVEDEGHRGQE